MSRELFQHKWFTCYEDDQGLSFLVIADGVFCVPVTDDNELVLITEYSPPYGKRVLFIPGGGYKPGESPEAAVNRELQEEAGFKAGRLDYLGTLNPLIKYIRGQLQVYLARELTPSQLQGDEHWDIGVERVPLADLDYLLVSGRVTDSNVVAALFMAKTFLANEHR